MQNVAPDDNQVKTIGNDGEILIKCPDQVTFDIASFLDFPTLSNSTASFNNFLILYSALDGI